MQHGLAAEEALAEIEPGVAPEHVQEPLQGRLVEPELALQIGDEPWVDARPHPGRCPRRLAQSLAGPEMRAVALVPRPLSSASACSTGPPGANCTTAKLIATMPISVGTSRSRRRRR